MYLKLLFLLAPLAIREAAGIPSQQVLRAQESCLKEHNLCIQSSDTSSTLQLVQCLVLLKTHRKAYSDIPTATKNPLSASNPFCTPTSMRKLPHSSQTRFPRPLLLHNPNQLHRNYSAPRLTPIPIIPRIAPFIASMMYNTMQILRAAADFASAVTVYRITCLVPRVCIGMLCSKCVTILQPRIVKQEAALHTKAQQLAITETGNCRTASWPKWYQSNGGHESIVT